MRLINHDPIKRHIPHQIGAHIKRVTQNDVILRDYLLIGVDGDLVAFEPFLVEGLV